MKWIAGTGGRVDSRHAIVDSDQKLRNSPAMSGPASHMKPMRWVAHLPLVILPILAAAAIQGPLLRSDLAGQVNAALAAAGQGWAMVTIRGRDVEVRGKPPAKAAAEDARATASAVFGVRRVTMRTGWGP